MSNIIPFPKPPEDKSEPMVMMTLEQVFQVLTKQKTVADIAWEKRHQERLDELRPYSIADLRRFWDNIGDDSFYTGPEGEFDCADIHRVMNEKGDGIYCAV